MGQIALEGMEFFAFHGFSDEEQKIGNKYCIDIFIETNLSKPAVTDNLEDTVDYSEVYAIVAKEMKEKSRLLEHVGYRIIEKVKTRFSSIKKVEIHVSKFNPPVGGVVNRSKIILEESF